MNIQLVKQNTRKINRLGFAEFVNYVACEAAASIPFLGREMRESEGTRLE